MLELKGRAIPNELHGQMVYFELKSATGGHPNISTVRDFGLHYLDKWRRLHWLFGVYESGKLQYCLYGSPWAMKPWFDQMAAYIAPDYWFFMRRLASASVNLRLDPRIAESVWPWPSTRPTSSRTATEDHAARLRELVVEALTTRTGRRA